MFCSKCHTSHPMQFVPEQQRYYCGTCGQWSDKVTPQPVDARNPPCPHCGQPTRLDLARGSFVCDQCQRVLGEGADQAIAKIQQNQKNKLGWKIWLGLLAFACVAAAGTYFLVKKEKKLIPPGIKITRHRTLPKNEEEIRGTVGTAVASRGDLVHFLNRGIKDLVASKDVKKGVVVLRFKYDQGNADGKQRWLIEGENDAVPVPMLIRVFDRNGKFLSGTYTEDRFLPESFLKQEHEGKVLGLSKQGNELRYAINQRDLEYVKGLEVGFIHRVR